MKIIFKGEYRSLSDFESENLPDFTVITGKNGSGKSQLVEQFRILVRSKQGERNLQDNYTTIEPDHQKIFTEQLVIDNLNAGNPVTHKERSIRFHQYFEQNFLPGKIKKVWNCLYQKRIVGADILAINISSPDLAKQISDLINTDRIVFDQNVIIDIVKELRNNLVPDSSQSYRIFAAYLKNNVKQYEIAKLVADYNSKQFIELQQSDFLNTVLPEKYYDNNDLISSKIENIFYGYLKKRDLNNYQHYRKTYNSEKNNSIPKEDFSKKYQAPWIIINKIFERLNLPYHFKNITAADFSPDANISFDLINNHLQSRWLVKK